jgi:quinol-cytochrome oxidoreductase complex cytochrome b subunit
VYNNITMLRNTASISVIALLLGAAIFYAASGSGQAPSPVNITATPTFDITRLAQPPTVSPPEQADNGAQIYWGMCSACHGDRGQGLTDEWRASFAPAYRNCWQSGCHGDDFAENSFKIPQTGAPALAGPGRLARFSNAFEMQSFIFENMPFSPPGSLTGEESLALTAFVLRMNDKQPKNLDLSKVNSAAIPVHRKVDTPGNGLAVTFALAGILTVAVVGLSFQARRNQARSASQTARPNFFHHLHPPSIPAEQSRFRYTLGAGGLAVFMIFILLVTGMLEMYYYVPTPAQAAVSVQTISTLVPFGNLIRNLHFWSAQFLVVLVTVHLLRVALTGACAPPRRFNYLLGLSLFVLVLLLDFTGYMLRWDEGIRWALVVGTNLLKAIPGIGQGLYEFVIGGSEPGAATLTRFYAWHIFGLAFIAGILVVWHIFRVRRDGGIAIPPPAIRQEKSRITRFELLRREVLAMMIASVILLLFSLLVPAPIDQPISSGRALTGDSRAPWFFLWIQQLLKLGNPFLWGVLTPLMVVIILGLLPYVLPNARKDELGRWFPAGNRITQILVVWIILTISLLTLWGALSK